MSDITPIKELEVGTRIAISYSDHWGIIDWSPHSGLPILEAEIVAIYGGVHYCLAWHNTRHGEGDYLNPSWLESWRKNPKDYIVMDNPSPYDTHKWVGNTLLVKRITIPELFPNQKCVGCDLPAPHVKPNTGDNFVCQSCQFLGSL